MYGTLTADEIDALLKSQTHGHLGCIDDGKPYVIPMAYVYNDNVIYGQTLEGMKTNILRRNPYVCFQVQNVSKTGWKSALVRGNFQELNFSELRDDHATHLVQLLTEKLGSIQSQMGIEIPFSFDDGARPEKTDGKFSTLFRIIVEEKTGRTHRTKDLS